MRSRGTKQITRLPDLWEPKAESAPERALLNHPWAMGIRVSTGSPMISWILCQS